MRTVITFVELYFPQKVNIMQHFLNLEIVGAFARLMKASTI